MKQLVEYIVSNLVNHPEDVVIEEEKTPGEEDSSSIIIKVNPEDIGRVIGRSGKVINAIRQIARIAAIQKGVRVRVDLKEESTEAPVVEP
ncbi:KH domain-containing protein, partial [Patescibacteria group bacterium]|nr:KH domain-containing protein [Patescibacteria group bacterium]